MKSREELANEIRLLKEHLRSLEKELQGHQEFCPPTVNDYMRRAFVDPEPIIGPIEQSQIILLASETGVGKSQFAMSLCNAISEGRDFQAWKSSGPRACLYIDGEMSPTGLRDRLRGYRVTEKGGNLWWIYNVASEKHELGRINLALPEWQDEIIRLMGGMDVLVLDNVMSLINVPGVSMSSDEFWQPVVDFNTRMRALGKTVIWVDHTNAQGESFGTRTKRWHADMVWYLKHPNDYDPEDGCRFVFECKKSRAKAGKELASAEYKMVEALDGKSDWMHAYVGEKELLAVKKLHDEGLSIRDIAEELDLGKSTVGRYVKSLQKQGAIRHRGNGYRPPSQNP